MKIQGGDIIAAITGGVFELVDDAVYEGSSSSEMLHISPAAIVAFFVWNGLGVMTQPSLKGEYPLYINLLPDGSEIPSNAGAVYDTSGVIDGRLTRGITIEHQGIQLRVRNIDYQEGWQKIREVCSYFENIHNQEVVIDDRTFSITSILRTSSIVHIGQDEKRRYEFTVNFLVTMKEV